MSMVRFCKLAYPKINLSLDVLGKEGDFHILRTVFFEVRTSFFDRFFFEVREDAGLVIKCDNPAIPMDENSPLYRAALMLQGRAPGHGAEIFLEKKIPMQAGLGGGSSDVAALLRGLVQVWNVKISHGELADIAASVSKDAAFFLTGGTALGEHFGEKITPLPSLPGDITIEIIDTGVHVSSQSAYRHLDLTHHCGKNVNATDALIRALHDQNSREILKNIHNDFEYSIFRDYPALAKRAKELAEKNPDARVILCGSGGMLAVIGAEGRRDGGTEGQSVF